MRRLFFLPILFLIAACSAENKEPAPIEDTTAAQIFKMADQHAGNKVVVVNFWATWCAPCVEELPYFIKLKENPNVELLLVSFDFEKDAAVKHLSKEGVDFTTYFNSQKQKNFFSEMPTDWGGELPYTLIFKKDGELLKSFSGMVSESTLQEFVNQANQ